MLDSDSHLCLLLSQMFLEALSSLLCALSACVPFTAYMITLSEKDLDSCGLQNDQKSIKVKTMWIRTDMLALPL